jgi:hypothetical protein
VCYKFNRWWWHSQKEAFFLEGSRDMSAVITKRAGEEKARLFNALKRRELEAILREKGRRAWKKMMKEEEERKLRENNARLSGGKKAEVKQTESEQKRPVVVILSEDRKRAAEIAKAKEEKHLSLLEKVKRACISVPGHVLQSKIETVAVLIVCIEREHPLIKWSIRSIFHIAARHHTIWDMEFLLQSLQGEKMEEGALAKMERLWLKKQ